MAKFRKKLFTIDAEQWFPGKEVTGVIVEPTTINYSENGDLYYVTRGDDRPKYWLSVAATPGPVPDDKKGAGFLEPQWLQIVPTGGEPYHRKALPFATWSVRSGKSEPLSEPLSEDTDLFKDYAVAHDWKAERPQSAHINTVSGRALVRAGDWIIDGLVMKDADFKAAYEPLPD